MSRSPQGMIAQRCLADSRHSTQSCVFNRQHLTDRPHVTLPVRIKGNAQQDFAGHLCNGTDICISVIKHAQKSSFDQYVEENVGKGNHTAPYKYTVCSSTGHIGKYSIATLIQLTVKKQSIEQQSTQVNTCMERLQQNKQGEAIEPQVRAITCLSRNIGCDITAIDFVADCPVFGMMCCCPGYCRHAECP